MSGRLRFIALPPSVLFLLSACDPNYVPPDPNAPERPTSVHCEGGQLVNNLPGWTIIGFIRDRYSIGRDITNTNNSNTHESFTTNLSITLHLTIDLDGTTLKGTAEVSWKRNDTLEYRQNPGVCAEGQLIESNDRKWVVNITGKIVCDANGKVRVYGSGMPDGSDIATTLHYQDYGCKAGCPPCYDATTGSTERVTWNSFDESGFHNNELDSKIDMTIPPGYEGDWYHEASMTIHPEAADAPPL